MVKLYASNINNGMTIEKYNFCLEFLDKNNKVKIGKYRRYEDSKRALLSSLLIRAIIVKTIGIKNNKIRLCRDEFGKPYLQSYDNFCFNISHSGDWVVCAIDNDIIGIDIEEMLPINYEIVDRFFSPKEVEALRFKAGKEKLEYFYDLWTLKESYLKAWGKGLLIPLNTFTIEIFLNGEVRLTTDNPFNNCNFRRYNIESNYKMAVCSIKKELPQDIDIKSIEEISDILKI